MKGFLADVWSDHTYRTAAILLGNIVITPIFNKLSSPSSKHLFSILATAFTFWILFEPLEWIQLLLISVATYFMALPLARLKYGPSAILVFLLAVLGANHYYLQIVLDNSQVMIYSTPMMVLVMKLSSFAYGVGDAVKDKRCYTKVRFT
jgi:lysophospholipid acyltransferase